MAQPPKTGGYQLITDEESQVPSDNERFDQYKLHLERRRAEEAAKKRRQEDLDKHLSQYENDPVSRAIATIEFDDLEAETQKAEQKAARDKERRSIANKHKDDPVMQAWALTESDIEKTKNLQQKQAFAEREIIEKFDKREKDSRTLDRMGMGNAFLRESLGAAVSVYPKLAAVPARPAEALGLVEEGTTNELYRGADAFGQAQEQSREDDFSPWLSRMYGGTAESYLQMMATPGGPYAKILGAGVMSGNQALTTAEDAGLEGFDRWRYAIEQGGLEAGIAILGQKLLGPGIESRMAGQAIAAQTVKQLVKNITLDGVKEVPEEVLTVITQDISSKLAGVSPELRTEDFVTHSIEAAVQSALMAGMANAPNAAKLAIPGRKPLPPTPEQPLPVDPAQPVEPVSEVPPQAPITPEEQVFLQQPSRTKYDAAVKAGMPPVAGGESGEVRKKYAAERLQAQNTAPLEPEAPPVETQEAPAETVSDDEYERQFLDMYREGVVNGQETNGAERQQIQQQEQQVEQGRQEGLLETPETPPGIGGMTAAAPTNDSAVPAAHTEPPAEMGWKEQQYQQMVDKAKTLTKDEFSEKYLDTFKRMMSYGPDQAGASILSEEMAAMFDAQPEWADEIEQSPVKQELQIQTPPDLASGVSSPDQPAPSLADPVSKPETPRRGIIGDMLTTGEVVQTASGRSTTPFPKIATDTARKLSMTLRKAEEWLQSNAVLEAESRGDEFNALQFRNEKPGKMPKATKDSMEEYLFGEQPKVVPSILKPLVSPSEKPEPSQKWTPKPEGVVRVVHISSKELSKSIRDKGLDYSKQGMVSSAARVVDNESDMATVDPRFKVGVAHVFDIPASEYRQHDDVTKSTGVIPAKYLVSQISISDGKPVVESAAKPRKPPASKGRSLRSIVLSHGGISAKSLRKDYDQKQLKADGLLGIMRISGNSLDELAQILESSGDLRVPDNRTPSDYLLEQLKINADGARAEYTDAEIEARLEAEREEYERVKEFEKDRLKELLERGEAEGIRAANAGEPDEDFSEEDANEIIDTSFDFGEKAAAEEPFKLEQPPKPKPKAPEFGDNENTKQGGLFDAGKKTDLPGQELLFNSDPGDLNNPKTQENKPKAEESDIKAAMRAELAKQEAEEAAAKAPKEPKQPKEPKTPRAPRAPRTKTGEKLGKLSEKTGKEAKESLGEWLSDMGDLGVLSVINNKALVSTAKMVRAQIADGVVKFADLVERVVAYTSPETARKLSDYLEAAWEILGETNSKLVPNGVSMAGKVAEILGQENEVTDKAKPEPAVVSQSPALALVESLESELLESRGIDAKRLWELADKAYGGTRAEGKYGPSEAYDALETAINLTILDARSMGMKTPAGQVSPEVALKNMLDMQKQIVSQTNRSGTKDTMQQFSTPPAYSYVVSQFVNMDARDVVLEPSAGTGDLAVHALNQKAKVHVNELDPKRAEMLKAVQSQAEDRLTISTEDALQLGNIMGQNLRPSVVLMNPPFSREGQRMGDKKMSGNDRNHIDAAMGSLIDGGRLVAIIGAGLHGPSKGFTTWLAETAKKHNVRANIEVNRDVYKGYGTTFPTRVLVIDKGTPTPKDGTLTAQADSLEQLLTMTKGIRNERNRGAIQPVAPGKNVTGNVDTTEGGQQPKAPDSAGTAASDPAKPHGNASGTTAKAPRRTSGAADTNAADDSGRRPDAADSEGTGSDPNASSKSAGRGTTDAAGEPTGNLAGQSPEPRRVDEKRTEIDESVLFEPYKPSIVPFTNSQPHPTSAVESAAMSAVEYPEINEVPNIDASIIEDGRLSDIQLEFIALAAHAHNQLLPSEERTGILFGDGTGMGKGRGIPGVILHNWNEGRKQAIWMSKNGKLHSDAMREWEELGGNPAQVTNLSDMPVDDGIDLKEGILFATYDTLKSRGKSGKTRAQQVIDWLPKDFDGVIAFDEAHLMGSDTAARAGVARDIQDKFPKARVVYASATAATEIDQLMFGSRLGLWGAATPFATAKEFAAKIGSAGVSAMESVALSLKAMGRYVSRSISFNDGTPDGTVGYRRLSHPLADHQVQMYDRLAEAWQKVIGEFEDAMDATGADNFARGFARGQFWSAHQRFFNDLVTSLQMPTVIESIEKDLAEGRSVVIQLTTTGAAQQARALAGRGTQSLDDFAVDPFSSLVELVRSQFPTQAYEEYVKDDGSVGKRPVVDSSGNPVKDADAVAAQQQLLSDLAEMESSMPDSPLDMILNYFGTENVAEVTGRNQRVVWQEQSDGTKKRVLEKRSQKKSNQADIDAFQEGKKRILVFSQAGGTGASYHADRRARNQQKRVHYLVQPGWVAADAIQGLGRTHRTNQKQAPEYILVQTDIPGQKRFISTIARRLTQLGALTRGQRTAGGGGVFEATDNLESTEASLALTEFFKSLENEDSVMSLDEFEEQTGLELRLRSTGAMKSDVNLPDITSFMNRMLSMKIDSQNKVFDQFDRLLQSITEARRISGELDQGVETIKGGNIRKKRDEVVFTHDSGAKTRYVQLTMDIPVPSRDFDTQAKGERFKDFIGYYKRKSNNRVFFVNESFSKTTNSGRVVDMIRLVPPHGETLREEAHTLGKLEKITRVEAESLWSEQYGNRPKTKPHTVDMITGAVLPVWDRLPQLQPKLSRALTAAGDMVLGVVLPPSKVNETLGKLGAEKNKVDVGATIKMLRTGKGDVQLVNGWMIQRARVQNEWRLEIIGPTPVSELVFQRQGVIIERIGFRARYFIPFGENTQTVFDAVTRGNPVQKVNRYDSLDTGDDAEVDSDVPETDDEEMTEEIPPAGTPDPATPAAEEAPVSELRKAADEAAAAVEAQKAENAKQNAIIIAELRKMPLPVGIPNISDVLAQALAKRTIGEIRLGVKQFEAFIKKLRADFSESDILSLKPTFIRVWNSARDKFGLDEATEDGFDAAMSNTVDVDVEQLAEAAKGEPERDSSSTETEPADREPPIAESTPAESQPDEGLYSTQNASTDQTRKALGMPARPIREKASRPDQYAMAASIAKTDAGRTQIDNLIHQQLVRPGALSVLENDLLGVRRVELKQKLKAALEGKVEAEKRNDDNQYIAHSNAATQHRQALEDVINILSTDASYLAGSQLQARKAWINDDFSVEQQFLEFTAAMGREPNEHEFAAIRKKSKELEESNERLQKLLDEAEAKNNDLEKRLKEAYEAAVADVGKKTSAAKQPTITERLAESGKKHIDNAFSKLSQLRGKAYSIETATAEITEALFELALGYSELGVVRLSDFLNRVNKRFGPDAKDFEPGLIDAWKKVAPQSTSKDLDAITAKIDITDDETIGRAARDLMRFVIERDGLDASAAGRAAAVDAVGEILEEFIPGITRDEVERAMSGIGIYSLLSKDEVDIVYRDIKAQLLLIEQAKAWDEAAKAEAIEPGSGKAPPPTGRQHGEISDEQRALRKITNEAKKASGISTTTEGMLRSALDAAKRMAQNRISDLDKAIKTKTPIRKSQKLLQPDQELLDLQARRDELQKDYDATFGKNQLSDEQKLNRAEKMLDRAIANIEADMKAGKLYPDEQAVSPTSPALEAKRAQLEALKASREELRISSGEAEARSDAAFERHLKERNARLAKKIADRDFAPLPKRQERVRTPEILKEMRRNQEMKQELHKGRKAWEFSRRHEVYKAFVKGPLTVIDVLRKTKTAFDNSMIGRQGRMLGGSHPLIYAKAIAKSFATNIWKAKSLYPTKQDLFDLQDAFNADENRVRMERIAKLEVTDVNAGAKAEEGNPHIPEWINDFPGMGGSERAASAFINTQRRLVFWSLVEKLATMHERKGGGIHTISNAELRVLGNAVNVPSGRGDIGHYLNGVEGVSRLFFSGRWWASRLMWLAGEPIWHEAKWRGGEGASAEVSKLVAIEWGKQALAQATFIGFVVGTMYAILGPPGDDEEWDFYWDPRSPYFGQIRFRNTYQDMTAGTAQHVSVAARLISQKQSNRWEGVVDADKGRIAGRYLQGKLAPVPSVPAEYLWGTMNPDVEFASWDWYKQQVEPLMFLDIEQSMPEGPVVGTALAILAYFGQNSRTQEERVKARKDTANEVRAARKQGKSQAEIDELLNKHFANQAAIEAKEALRTAEPEDAERLQKIVDGEKTQELSEAIQKERGDLTLKAAELLSSEDKKEKKSPEGDKAIEAARSLLLAMAPTYEEANALYTEAYTRRNGRTTELVGEKGKKRWAPKKNVLAARRRLKAMYPE